MRMKNKYILIALVLVALLGVGGVIQWSRHKNNLMQAASSAALPDANAAVATLDSGKTTITRGQLDTQIQGLANNPQIQIPKKTDTDARAKFERLVLDQMIGGILLFDEAQRQGFTTDDAAIDKEFASITAQYKTADELDKALTAANVTKDALRENIRRNLIINQYYDKITKEHPVTASAEEIKAFYDTQVVPQDPKIVFKDVESKIKTQIEQQKTQEVLKGIVEGLRQSADVKVLI